MRTHAHYIPLLIMLAPCLASSQVAISEFMFDPLTVNGIAGAEYVELYNAGNDGISIDGWKLYDATGKAQATVGQNSPRINPGGLLVIASDTSIYSRFPALRDSSNVVIIGKASFSLNADEDDVVIRDAAGRTVDSVRYSSHWHRADLDDTKGVALERVSMTAGSNDRHNWSSSVAQRGGTPGEINSVSVPTEVVSVELAITPRTISPDDDGFEDFTRISYRLPVAAARIVVTAYDRRGGYIRRIANNDITSSNGEVIWDGRDDDERALPPGVYLIRLDAYDPDGTGVYSASAAAIVARRF